MRVDRQTRSHRWLQMTLLCGLLLGLGSCKVYTINKTDLEKELKPNGQAKHLSIGNIYRKQFKNEIDTMVCVDASTGEVKLKHFTPDSKITIVTKGNRAIKYYAKSLYIYKDQFLIGERTAPKLRGPNYFPVRLSDIDRIQVTTLSF
jgi:hypothetical protein